jgi:methyl-accepting chemotaxis protein
MDNHLIEKLKEENKDLQFKLNDLEYLLEMKEEELSVLNKVTPSIAVLQSKLDQYLYEMEQMQLFIGEKQQSIEGAQRREGALEEEVLQSIKIEKLYYQIKTDYDTLSAMIEEMNQHLSELPTLIKKNADMIKKMSALESEIELLTLDNHFLKEDLKGSRIENINTKD